MENYVITTRGARRKRRSRFTSHLFSLTMCDMSLTGITMRHSEIYNLSIVAVVALVVGHGTQRKSSSNVPQSSRL